MQHQLGDGASGPIRAVADRTRDLIPAVVRVFAFLHPEIATDNIAERTMVRLELGLPAELVELGTALGADLTRAQYLSLLEQGVMTADQFEAADSVDLARILGVKEERAAVLQMLLTERGRQHETPFKLILPIPTE